LSAEEVKLKKQIVELHRETECVDANRHGTVRAAKKSSIRSCQLTTTHVTF